MSRGLVHPQSETQVRVESGVLARPSSRRGRLEVGQSQKRVPLLGQAFRSEIWIALPACCLGFWASPGVAHRLQRCLLGQAFVGKLVHEGPWVYEPDIVSFDS